MYYDLHCGARPQGPIEPGTDLNFAYTVRYLSPAESREVSAKSRPIPITTADRETFAYPRFELGLNRFDEPVRIDQFDDASGFRPKAPEKVWDREVGGRGRGSLRLTNAENTELAWTCEPPTQIPPETELTLVAMVRTQGCTGRGIFLRVRLHTFVWRPKPQVIWADALESEPVTGTADWTRIEVPLLATSAEDIDSLVAIDVVLDGPGTAWLTDCDIQLVHVKSAVPVG
jgi:hypothetical protein